MIKLGKLKFEELAKAEMIRQEKKAPREVKSGKTTIPRDDVSIAKDKKGEMSGSLTTKGSKEQLCKPNKEKEKKMFQHTIRELELMLKEQKEYFVALREEYHRQTSGQGQASENDDA